MKVGVVGPTGVLGRALLPLLQESGHEVRALALSPARVHTLFPQIRDVMQCDLLAVDVLGVSAMLRGCDAAVHIATAIPRDATAPHAWDVNTRLRTEGTEKLLQASLKAGVSRYLQQSIVMAYPDHGDEWITEDAPLDDSPERAAICAPVIRMEQLVRDNPPQELAWCILRGGTFVGPHTFQEGTIEELREGTLVVPCDGSNFNSFVHVADMARAIVAALASAPPGSIFNVVDEPLRQGGYLDRLAAAVGAPQPARDETLHCPPSWRCSNEAIRAALGWRPARNLIP
jgi:nucleoside-diphosphate-sugar epimerase